MGGEATGVAVFATALAILGALIVTARLALLDDLAAWALDATIGMATARTLAAWAVLLVVLALLVAWARGSGAARVDSHVHADDDPDGSVALAILHEGPGHAAVAHGTGVRVGRVEVDAHGGGVTNLHPGDWRRAHPAVRLAILRAGEAVAGPAGCRTDRRDYATELRRTPRAERATAEAEAARLVAVHARSAFGQRVARALERRGQFR